jgi:hypothetical protein
MSLKKATSKAVFEACEQLELQDRSWNRDDVRTIVGGGSFSVIDPLIQAWRKLQPVREVAPNVPADLLIQVATMLEDQISGYIKDIEARDQKREEALLEANKLVAENLQEIELELTEQLELSQQANHDLEAECSRLESELEGKSQSLLTAELKLQVSKEGAASLNQRIKEQQTFYESSLKQQKQSQQEENIRASELLLQQMNQLKLESQQQLSQQKTELLDASQITENRLMRLLDQGRNELKELQLSSSNKIEDLNREQQVDKRLANKQRLEVNTLESSLTQAEQQARKDTEGLEAQITQLNDENANLQGQLAEYKSQGAERGKSEFQQLRDSIRLLQEQVSK